MEIDFRNFSAFPSGYFSKTKSLLNSNYEIRSKNVEFLLNENVLRSKEKTIVKDNDLNIYHLDEFKYLIDQEELRGNNIIAISNFGLPKSDKMYFIGSKN